MKNNVRCKACGFVMAAEDLGEVCPACGVKKEMFEPWDDKVGTGRRLWLDLHLHPIIVHIPNSLSPLLVLFALAWPFLPGGLQGPYFWPIIQFLSWLFPLSVAGGFVSGLVDGKVRYRKLGAPLLLRKTIISSLLTVASLVQAGLVFGSPFAGGMSAVWAVYTGAAVVSLVTASLLGKWGSHLFGGAMPGDKVFLGRKKKKPASHETPPKA